jgi:hypothetical protein
MTMRRGRLWIIFGAVNEGMAVNADGASRIAHVAMRFEPGDHVIIAGGVFAKGQQAVPIALAMRAHAIDEFGLPPGAISVETGSQTTIQNVLFVYHDFRDLIQAFGPPRIVSASYHVLRCWLAWNLLTRTRAKLSPARLHPTALTARQVRTELEGVCVVLLYACGIRAMHDRLLAKHGWPQSAGRTAVCVDNTALQSGTEVTKSNDR